MKCIEERWCDLFHYSKKIHIELSERRTSSKFEMTMKSHSFRFNSWLWWQAINWNKFDLKTNECAKKLVFFGLGRRWLITAFGLRDQLMKTSNVWIGIIFVNEYVKWPALSIRIHCYVWYNCCKCFRRFSTSDTSNEYLLNRQLISYKMAINNMQNDFEVMGRDQLRVFGETFQDFTYVI